MAPIARHVVDAQNGDPNSRIITYDTTLSPAEVYSFYEQALGKDGWEENGLIPKPQLTAEGMAFEWEQITIDGLGDVAYRFHVLATATIQGTTAVQLDISKYDPRQRY